MVSNVTTAATIALTVAIDLLIWRRRWRWGRVLSGSKAGHHKAVASILKKAALLCRAFENLSGATSPSPRPRAAAPKEFPVTGFTRGPIVNGRLERLDRREAPRPSCVRIGVFRRAAHAAQLRHRIH
jgi:hypothetical protein